MVAALTALWLAMVAVLGPRSINEKKVSEWATHAEVLGLEFDTKNKTVSMPTAKILKAQGRVDTMADRKDVSRHELECLLGSLGHVSTCLRSARPFFQRLHLACKQSLQLDLQWFRTILERGDWGGLPTTLFWGYPEPDVHLYMDASDQGLAVLDPARQRYIQLQFSNSERLDIATSPDSKGFTINVRELFCVGLAAAVWGAGWLPIEPCSATHIRAWSDNASAVAWGRSHQSDNTLAQELIRALGLSEATSRFRISTRHLPGAINIAASHSSSPGHLTSVQDLLAKLQAHALAGSSNKKYATTWKQWCHWCSSTGASPWLKGDRSIDSNQLIALALYYWQRPDGTRCNTASTILSKLGHISWYHRRVRGYAVGLHEGHKLAMQGMSRLSPTPKRKRPVSVIPLHRLRSNCGFRLAHNRVLGGEAAVVGFFFLLRRSEYLADHGRSMPYAIQRQDVSFWTREGSTALSVEKAYIVQVKFRGSKTDQRGVGMTRSLDRSTSQ
ncbi:hypothetical protein PHMEG_00018115 [Phytophthora megakarya]|uniref:Uncharacterized protein n=1 Tax=Phytophthora megakarya TaxID=4795 RepID=A0A225VWD7_9STRA|nr:hypothetical protein PHMEG_00018115 [Phytophthora megakarya]